MDDLDRVNEVMKNRYVSNRETFDKIAHKLEERNKKLYPQFVKRMEDKINHESRK